MTDTINPKNYKFCPICGNVLAIKYVQIEQIERLVCTECNYIFYMNPVPAVAVIIQNENNILLVKRKFGPKKGDWTLPAGFMEFNETSEEAAIRETKEETNLDITVKKLFSVQTGFDDPRVHVILIVYKAEIKNGTIAPGDDAADVRFFPLDKLPDNIAFSAHRKVIEKLK